MIHPALTRFAVIADIHGNSDALTAVLSDIDALGIDEIVNLGDHFSGPLAAGETAEILRSRPMTTIRGNHDRVLLEQAPAAMPPSDRVAFDELTAEDLDWLRGQPSTLTLGEVFLCHGTPDDDNLYWLEAISSEGRMIMAKLDAIERLAAQTPQSLLLCAHTHTARMVQLSDGRLVVNPGSVGCPGYDDDQPAYHVMQTGSPDARYAVVERVGDGWRVSFRAVPYDASRMAGIARQQGREEWARAVESGWAFP